MSRNVEVGMILAHTHTHTQILFLIAFFLFGCGSNKYYARTTYVSSPAEEQQPPEPPTENTKETENNLDIIPQDFLLNNPDLNPSLKLDFSWEKSDNADFYEIVVSENEDCSSPIVSDTVTKPSYTPTQNLENNKQYYLCVTAKNSHGSKTQKIPFKVIFPPGPFIVVPPSAPVTTLQPTFTWSPSTYATKYNLSYGSTDSCGISLGSTTLTAYSFTTKLNNFQSYHICVEAETEYGDKLMQKSSFTVAISIPTLTGLTVAATSRPITISWAGVSGAANYSVVIRSTNCLGPIIVAEQNPTTNSINANFGSLINGSTYYACVKSNGAWGSTAEASQEFTLSIPPEVPAGVSASDITWRNASISWIASAEATSYEVCYSASPSACSASTNCVSASSPYSLSLLNPSATYNVCVVAKGGSPEKASAASSSISVITIAAPSPITGDMAIPQFVSSPSLGMKNSDHFVSYDQRAALRSSYPDCYGEALGLTRLVKPTTDCGTSGDINTRIANCNLQITECGATWELVTKSSLGEVWLDSAFNRLWSDVMRIGSADADRFTWCRASGANDKVGVAYSSNDFGDATGSFEYCNEGVGYQDYPKPLSVCFEHPHYDSLSNGKGGLAGVIWYLPTAKELQQAVSRGARKILPSYQESSYPWSSSVIEGSLSTHGAWNLNSHGYLSASFRVNSNHVRCTAVLL
jgi:hypothetical protein